jgi:hypothetical protein
VTDAPRLCSGEAAGDGGSVVVTGAQSPEYFANAIARTSGPDTRMRA